VLTVGNSARAVITVLAVSASLCIAIRPTFLGRHGWYKALAKFGFTGEVDVHARGSRSFATTFFFGTLGQTWARSSQRGRECCTCVLEILAYSTASPWYGTLLGLWFYIWRAALQMGGHGSRLSNNVWCLDRSAAVLYIRSAALLPPCRYKRKSAGYYSRRPRFFTSLSSRYASIVSAPICWVGMLAKHYKRVGPS